MDHQLAQLLHHSPPNETALPPNPVLPNQTNTTSLLVPFRPLDSHLLLAQLTLGLAANLLLLLSVLASMRQSASAFAATAHRSAFYSSASSHRQIPVIDLIIAFLSIIGLLRLIGRGLPMVACFYGLCTLSPSICYLHGFLNTFLHCLHLWTMALVVHDRYIAQLSPSSYLCKCSHCILYVSLTGVAFLAAMHYAAPVYGFAAYRFVRGELTCTVDWLSRFSCPFWIYTFLLVTGPAYLPLTYWSIQLTLQRIRSSLSFCCVHQPSTPSPTTINKSTTPTPPPKSLLTSFLSSKPIHLLVPCCPTTESTRIEHSICVMNNNTFEMQSTKRGRDSMSSQSSSNGSIGSSSKRRYRKKTTPTSSRKATYQRQSFSSSDRNLYINPATILGPNSQTNHSRSHVLTHSKELPSLTLCAWAFVLAYAPKLIDNGCRACLAPSPYPPITDEAPNPPPILISATSTFDLRLTYYLALLDETAACVLVPLVLLVFHSKCRFALIVLLACLLSTCQLPCRPIRGLTSTRTSCRRSSRTSYHRTSKHSLPASSISGSRLSKIGGKASCEPITSASTSGTKEDGRPDGAASMVRSNSLRINYASKYTKAKHYQSERNIAVTVI